MRNLNCLYLKGRIRNNRSGQSSVEYLLLISVLVMGLFLLLSDDSVFTGQLQSGLHSMHDNVSGYVSEGVVGGGP